MFPMEVFNLLKQLEIIVVDDNARTQPVSVTNSFSLLPALRRYESTMSRMEKLSKSPIQCSQLKRRASPPLSASSRWEACSNKKDTIVQPLSRPLASVKVPHTCRLSKDSLPRQPRRSEDLAASTVKGQSVMRVC